MDDRKWSIRVEDPNKKGGWVTLEEVEEKMAFFQIYEVNSRLNFVSLYIFFENLI